MDWVRALQAIDEEVRALLRELATLEGELAQAKRAAAELPTTPPEHLRAYA